MKQIINWKPIHCLQIPISWLKQYKMQTIKTKLKTWVILCAAYIKIIKQYSYSFIIYIKMYKVQQLPDMVTMTSFRFVRLWHHFSLADPRGRPRRAPPKGSNSFISTHNFFKRSHIGSRRPTPYKVGAPSYGKSWIRHCFLCLCPNNFLLFQEIHWTKNDVLHMETGVCRHQ